MFFVLASPVPSVVRGSYVVKFDTPLPSGSPNPAFPRVSALRAARTAVQAGTRRALGAYSQRANGYFFASLRGLGIGR